MERKRDHAFKVQDYEMLKALVKDLKIVFEVIFFNLIKIIIHS